MLTVDEATAAIREARAEWGTETVPLDAALGRVLAEDVSADRDYPPFNRATMDGFAVKSDDVLKNPAAAFRIIGELFAGDDTAFTLHAGEALRIMTGAPVPDSADAVIKKEDAAESDGSVRFAAEGFARHQHIARRGEDIRKDGIVLSACTQLRFGHLSLLAAVGRTLVTAARLPRVAIISTGNEIVPVADEAAPHQIRDSKSWAIAGFLKKYSIVPLKTVLASDTMEDLVRVIEPVLAYDMLIISGGVSAGDADLVPQALAACGVSELFHRVRVKPGKPLWFGRAPGGIRVFALPGNPFSVQTACRIFIEPYLRACFGLPEGRALSLPLNGSRKKRTGFDEFFPAALAGGDAACIAPLSYTTSGDITAIAGSDGVALHAAAAGDLKAGDSVKMFLWEL